MIVNFITIVNVTHACKEKVNFDVINNNFYVL
jgi:hypothetical protein